MEVKEAVRLAKAHAAIVFEDEPVRIEEVWFDAQTQEWCITVGLQRAEPATGFDLAMGRKMASSRMHYKTIRLSDAGVINSVRNHDKTPISTP